MEYTGKTFTVTFEKFKQVSFASSIMEDTAVFPVLCRFLIKLICWNAFGSASVSCYLLKSISDIITVLKS